MKLRLFVSLSFDITEIIILKSSRKRTCNAQPIYSSSDYCQTVGGLIDTSPADTMLPKAAIIALVFQLADYLGMRWLLLIYPLYIWLTGSKFACDRPRKQGTTEQVVIIDAASDKGNDANTLCSRG